MKARFYKTLSLLIISLVLIASVAAGAHSLIYRDRIFPGVEVETLDVGGKSLPSASALIQKTFPERDKIVLTHRDSSWTVEMDEIGVKIEARETAEAAYAIGRGRGLLGNLIDRVGVWRRGKTLPISWSLNSRRAGAAIEEIAKLIDRPAVSAELIVNNKEVKIEPHHDGLKTDTSATLERLKKTLLANKLRARMVVKRSRPEKTTADIKNLKIEEQLAEFSTSLSPIRNGRRHNIELAMKKLDGHMIKSGEIFSFNRVVGARSREAGFTDAPVIERGMLVQGIGGGICQVATTLYNAAMISGLPIVERTLHSNFISNYPAGRDATVADGLLDLKFKNDTGGTLLVKTVILREAVVFKIYGPKTGRVNWFSDPLITNYNPYGTKVETDTTLPPGVRVKTQGGVDGKTVKVNRRVTLDKKTLIDETIVSRYSPRQELIRVGPEPPPLSPEPAPDASATP